VCFTLTARRTRDAVDCHRVVIIVASFVTEKDIVFTSQKRVTWSRTSDGNHMIDRIDAVYFKNHLKVS